MLKELRRKYADKLERYNDIKETGDMEEVRALHAELLNDKERIVLLEEERALELETFEVETNTRATNNTVEVRDMTVEQVDKEYEKTFLRAFRGKPLSQRDQDIYQRMVELRDVPTATPYMQTDSDADGGFIVPRSVSTMINEYKRQGIFDLTTLVDVQTTAVLSGEFTYEKLGTITPWENISQWDNINEVATPQFERKEYKIQDYAGILPLPRTLLQDTDQNLLSHIAKYIARKTLITRNAKVLEVIDATYTSKKLMKTTDDFKDTLDLELDPAFLPQSVIVTNQHGYNFLRKMKGKDGKYLLQPDVTQPDKKQIDGKQVVVIPTSQLPNVTTKKAPIYIGDFKEAIRFYDRGVYEITPTTIGGKAFIRNSYDIRVIDRFTAIALDSEAVVAAEIDFTVEPDPAPVEPEV